MANGNVCALSIQVAGRPITETGALTMDCTAHPEDSNYTIWFWTRLEPPEFAKIIGTLLDSSWIYAHLAASVCARSLLETYVCSR